LEGRNSSANFAQIPSIVSYIAPGDSMVTPRETHSHIRYDNSTPATGDGHADTIAAPKNAAKKPDSKSVTSAKTLPGDLRIIMPEDPPEITPLVARALLQLLVNPSRRAIDNSQESL
jgi:hypothetical protein